MGGMFGTVLSNMVSLVLLMAVGFICRQLRILNDEVVAGLSQLLMKVTLPATIVMSMQKDFSTSLLEESLLTLAISAAVYFAGTLIATLLARLLRPGKSATPVWQFALTFPNVGYMGFPVTNAIFGDSCLMYTSMANVSFNVMAFTFGIGLVSKDGRQKGGWRKILINPAIISAVLGFALFLFSFRLPAPLAEGAQMTANMTTPLSMLVVGALLAKYDLKTVFKGWKMYPLIAVRLLVLPLLIVWPLHHFIMNPVMRGVLIILPAMPAAALTAIFAEAFGGDSQLASRLVFVSTIASVLTIPLVSLLM